MSFNSYLFVFVFFPLCMAGYHILSRVYPRALKLWLIAASAVFGACGSLPSLGLFAVTMAVNYGLLKLILRRQKTCPGENGSRAGAGASAGERPEISRAVRWTVFTGVLFNLAVLGGFKYFNFFAGTVYSLLGRDYIARHILLPLGISYMTFQQISLLVDASRGELGGELRADDYVLYTLYFPKLLSGPIAGFGELRAQFGELAERSRVDGETFCRGAALFIMGLAKKCIFAAWAQNAVNYVYANIPALTFGEGLIGMLCISFTVYYDFSGYCDMGQGISRMLGLSLPVNFRSPLKTWNIVGYWRNWHITLTRFMTKYVYIPLGGNRRGRGRMCRNLLLIYLLSGLWHGANMTFVLWGLLNGLLYIPVKLWLDRRGGERDDFGRLLSPAKRAAGRIGNLLINSAIFVPFMASSVGEAGTYFRAMGTSAAAAFAAGRPAELLALHPAFLEVFRTDELWYVLKAARLASYAFAPYLCLAVIFGLLAGTAFFAKEAREIAEKGRLRARNGVLLAGLFVWCVCTFSQVTTFIYTNF